MIILSIETSCDETAVSIVDAKGELNSPSFTVLGNALFSQIDIHKEYGGVYPTLAKREHTKKLPLLLKKVLSESNMYNKKETPYSKEKWHEIKKITEREENLYEGLKLSLENIKKPDIDVIAVTSGPGLEPALWVGISCAQALEKLWDIPILGVNHMEGHILSVILENSDTRPVKFPALALLISGGHTELVEMEKWGKYKILGETRDDAVGEAFDKTARMLGLSYPGGPQISKLASHAREQNIKQKAKFTRPMLHSNDFDFSFSGLKTAVLYYIRDHGELSETEKADIAREFEDTAIDVLFNKTIKALEKTMAKTLIIAGGVIANKKLRETFLTLENKYKDLVVKIPTEKMATDNALMIASATFINVTLYPELLLSPSKIVANGNLRLG